MLKSVCGVRTKSAHYVQTRFAQRMRGKPPLLCKTIKQRLDELNYKDELYTTKIDIGFPIPKLPSEIRKSQLEHFKKVKSDKNFEKQARDGKIRVNLDEVRKEWLKTVGPAHLKRVAEHYGIFEHLYVEGYFMPLLNLEILYNISNDTYLPVYSGNVIKPAEAQQPPLVNFETDGNSLWTLVLTNLDGHLTENDKEYVHWLVANIPGNNIEKGDTIVEYLKPFPLKGTGYHRYVFVLYKQQGRVDYDITKVTSTALEQRTFVTKSWYQKYQDVITPTGLAFFQSDWDETVRDFFHKVLDTKEPVYEYDFPAPYIRPQEKHPRDKAFNIYMDRYRDPKQINKEYLLRKLKDEDPFKGPKPPLMYPNAHPLPHSMPSWLKLHETKIRMRWGRINEV